MDKLKKIKHEHKLTDLLKFVIFSLIMLAPFFSIGGRMAYTIFNKNAKDNYSGENNNQVLDFTYQMVQGKTYNLQCPSNLKIYNNSGGNANAQIRVSNVFVEGNNQYDFSNIDRIGFYTASSSSVAFSMYFFNEGDTTYFTSFNSNTSLKITFTFVNQSSGFTSYILNNDIFYRETGNQYYYIDNAFDYSISKIADEPVFNWVKNTAIYDGINAMFTGLEYDTENNPIAIMCAYWLLNTAVYIVIDIVVWAFTKMTHMFVQE